MTWAQCGICRNSLSHFFDKNFVKVTFLLKNILKSWFDEIFLGDSKFFIFPHCGAIMHIIGVSTQKIQIFTWTLLIYSVQNWTSIFQFTGKQMGNLASNLVEACHVMVIKMATNVVIKWVWSWIVNVNLPCKFKWNGFRLGWNTYVIWIQIKWSEKKKNMKIF